MAKTGRKKDLITQLSSRNLTRICRKAIRNAILENIEMGLDSPVLGKDGKVKYLSPRQAKKELQKR